RLGYRPRRLASREPPCRPHVEGLSRENVRSAIPGGGPGMNAPAMMRRALMRTLDYITQILLIIGGLNWLLVGIFNFDLVAAIFGGRDALLSEIIYTLVGVSALYQLFRLFGRRHATGPAPERRTTAP